MVLRFSGSPVHLELNEAGSKNGEGRTLYFAAAVFLVGESNYEIHTTVYSVQYVPTSTTLLPRLALYLIQIHTSSRSSYYCILYDYGR